MIPKLKIRIYPDSILNQKAAPVTDFGPPMQELFDSMVETMYEFDGVGLAAPQIGISKQIFIACPTMRKGEEFVMINPVLEKTSGEKSDNEGCLSLPGIFAAISRATKIKLLYQDRHGKKIHIVAEDFFARVIQHEIDHLNGKLLIDHFTGAKREELLQQFEEAKKNPSKGKGRDAILAQYEVVKNNAKLKPV